MNFLEKPEKGIIEIEDLKVDVEKATKQQIHELRLNTSMVFKAIIYLKIKLL